MHTLGPDFKNLTHSFNGRDMRLTDVHGKVINEILASWMGGGESSFGSVAEFYVVGSTF